jgi:hypothetical protein
VREASLDSDVCLGLLHMKVGPYKLVSVPAGSPSFQLGRVKPPESVRDEEMQSGIMVNSSEKNALKKPLEELTDADILQLTREDCRRYLKERGGTDVIPVL